MREAIKTTTGKLTVDTNTAGLIRFEAEGYLGQQTHNLTIEQCGVLLHALERVIDQHHQSQNPPINVEVIELRAIDVADSCDDYLGRALFDYMQDCGEFPIDKRDWLDIGVSARETFMRLANSVKLALEEPF